MYTGPLTVQSTPDKSKVGVDRRLKQITTSLACSTFLQKYEPYIQFHGSLQAQTYLFSSCCFSQKKEIAFASYPYIPSLREGVNLYVCLLSLPLFQASLSFSFPFPYHL